MDINLYFIKGGVSDHRSLNKMNFNWDFLIGLIVIIGLVLVVWAKVSKQTIGEVLGSIKDMLSNKKDEVQDTMYEVVDYA